MNVWRYLLFRSEEPFYVQSRRRIPFAHFLQALCVFKLMALFGYSVSTFLSIDKWTSKNDLRKEPYFGA